MPESASSIESDTSLIRLEVDVGDITLSMASDRSISVDANLGRLNSGAGAGAAIGAAGAGSA